METVRKEVLMLHRLLFRRISEPLISSGGMQFDQQPDGHIFGKDERSGSPSLHEGHESFDIWLTIHKKTDILNESSCCSLVRPSHHAMPFGM
jgi:hypothetical protein